MSINIVAEGRARTLNTVQITTRAGINSQTEKQLGPRPAIAVLIDMLKSVKRSSHILLRGGRDRILCGSAAENGLTRRRLDELRAGPVQVARLADLPLTFTRLESRHVRVGGVDGGERGGAHIELLEVRSYGLERA